MTDHSFAIVGRGRAGSSFARALGSVGWTLVRVAGRGDPIVDVGADVDVVILAVPDDSITEVAAAIEASSSDDAPVIVHVSGAKGLDVLEPHRRRASVHPLMSLPDGETGAERLLGGGVFAVAGDPNAGADLATEMVAALGGRRIEVGDAERPLYHAAAAVAANHTVVLCAQVERLAAQVGVPVDAYWDLIDGALASVRSSGAVSSLTGPAARGDETTLAEHVAALPPAELRLYVTLAQHAARLAGANLAPGWESGHRLGDR
jgi:predicted short-subunit dehydrogenase-like oxidoreductase (DUF2520 family)